MKINIICGLGFGDEGKGATVNWLAKKNSKSLVIRMNGGHQVGHTVVNNGVNHVFSNFGSGTFQNCHTYWSEYCTVNPMGVYKEGLVLEKLGLIPKNIYNANAMITTPFDVFKNQKLEKINNRGSVGVGFGQTIQRNEDYFNLYARDLLYPSIRDAKLNNIQNLYYQMKYNSNDNDNPNTFTNRMKKIMDDFIIACDNLIENYPIINHINEVLDELPYYDIIFEGGQGILLDQHYGFFPNVTRSNTTSKNAFEIINNSDLNKIKEINTYYITRAYQTRHGNGYMTNENLDKSFIKDNPNETNISGGFQGEFRKSVLDLDLLNYAISCDKFHNLDSIKNLVITCLDQVPDKFPVTHKGKIIEISSEEFKNYLNFNYILHKSYSDEGVSN